MPKKVKITESGQPCRHCQTPVNKVLWNGKIKPFQRYYYDWYLRCPKCGAFYMQPEALRSYADLEMKNQLEFNLSKVI
jgi:hypothetical protein